ncbi:MAG: hypothetical protein AAFQ37_00880 [Bacteroidota bacterium]
MPFFDFDLIRQPTAPALIARDSKKLLIVYQAGSERLTFLTNILKAAGYDQPSQQLHLLALNSNQDEIDLSATIRQLSLEQIIVFGIQPAALGLHFQLAKYVSVKVNHVWFLLADDLAIIQSEKAAGKPQKAGALWKAIKAKFLRSED